MALSEYGNALNSSSEQRFQVHDFENVHACTGQVAEEGEQRNVFEVPAEVDFFQAHGNHAGSRADDEDAATHAGAIGDKFPESTVLHEVGHVAYRAGVGNGIHAHGCCHEGHIVDNR